MLSSFKNKSVHQLLKIFFTIIFMFFFFLMYRHVRAEQTECYIQALQWILFYYYRGVPSWSWFYEFHYR